MPWCIPLHQLYGIILPTPDEIKEAERKLESAPLDIELIDEFRQPMKMKDTMEGKALKATRDKLMHEIRELAGMNGYYSTSRESPV